MNNPCCSGMLADQSNERDTWWLFFVLILVVMEYSLTSIGMANSGNMLRLNPCCNGILPDTDEHFLDIEESTVLILVVMEYSLTGLLPDEHA